jgi:hypothetical protein
MEVWLPLFKENKKLDQLHGQEKECKYFQELLMELLLFGIF